MFFVSVEDVQCVLWLSRLDLISSSLAHSTLPSDIANPRGCFPFVRLCASCYLDRKSLFGDSWNAGMPLTPLRIWGRSPVLTLQHTSLADTAPWMDGLPTGYQTTKNHTALWWSTLWETVKWGTWVFLSSLPCLFPHLFLSPSTLPDFQLSGIPHLCIPSISPTRNLPFGRFCIFYQTWLVPRFCIFILSSPGWGVLRAHRLFGVGKAGRMGTYTGTLQLWVMRSRQETLNFTLQYQPSHFLTTAGSTHDLVIRNS